MGWSTGNHKVDCPVFSATSARSCPCRAFCEFSRENYKRTGKPLCYAADTETHYSGVAAAREANEAAIKDLTWAHFKAFPVVVRTLARDMALATRKTGVQYVRYNESGDFAEWNIEFFTLLTQQLTSTWGVRPFCYTKQPKRLWRPVEKAGCVILVSERDFVAVPDIKTARTMKLPVCPGQGCGHSCLRCPMGLQTAVVYH